MKKIVSFFKNGWVNLFVGFLVLIFAVYFIYPYQDSLHSPSVAFGILLFVSSDIMGYGISTILAGRRNKKVDRAADDTSD